MGPSSRQAKKVSHFRSRSSVWSGSQLTEGQTATTVSKKRAEQSPALEIVCGRPPELQGGQKVALLYNDGRGQRFPAQEIACGMGHQLPEAAPSSKVLYLGHGMGDPAGGKNHSFHVALVTGVAGKDYGPDFAESRWAGWAGWLAGHKSDDSIEGGPGKHFHH